jgi:hypothetical protein
VEPAPSRQEPFWEYELFGAELAHGLAALEPQFLDYQTQVTREPPMAVGDPPTNLHWFTDQIATIAARVTEVLEPHSLEEAFGPPGVAGDEPAIRAKAAALCAIYADLLSWGARVRSVVVDDRWRPVYAALAQFASLPLHQLQDFSALVSASIARITAAVRAGTTSEEHLVLTLTMAIDPAAESAFTAALAAAKRSP